MKLFDVASISFHDLLEPGPEPAADVLDLLLVHMGHHLHDGGLQGILGVVMFRIDLCLDHAPHVIVEGVASRGWREATSRGSSGMAGC